MYFFELSGRLGNNLFQLAFGYILYMNNGKKILFIPKSNKIGRLDIFNRIPGLYFPRCLLCTCIIGKLFIRIKGIQRFNLESQLNIVLPSDIQSEGFYSGYFQNARYLSDFKPLLIDLFRVRKKFHYAFMDQYDFFFKDNKKVLTIHVRLGDYLSVVFKEVSSLAFVGWDWYRRALNRLDLSSFDHVFLVSDDINFTVEMLGNQLPKYLISDGDELTDFLLLRQSHTLIISNSSFAWWAGFLNETPDKVVLAPYNWIGHNSGIEYPSQIMIDEFTWVK